MFNYKNYENTSLVFTKPVPYYGIYEKLELYHKNNNLKKKIVLQTPPMFISFDVIEKEKNNSMCISFSKKDSSNNVSLFYDFIRYLDDIIKKLCKTKKQSWFKGQKIKNKSIISKYKTFYEFMSLNLPKKNGNFMFDIYDEKLNKVGMDKLTRNTEVSIIIELSSLYIGNGIIGCNWNVLQIKKYDTLSLDECLIIDDDDIKQSIPLPPPLPPPLLPPLHGLLNNPVINKKYEKYFKMLKMGIIIQAIKQAMVKDGYDVAFVEKLPDDINQFKLKLNSLPNQNNSTSNNLVPSTSSLLNMKNLLKKADINKPQKQIINKNDGFAPSLADIQNILNRLKKPGQIEIKNNEIQCR